MPKRITPLPVMIVMALLVSGAALVPSPHPTTAQTSNCRTFSETGRTVCGVFLSYWDTHGGLAQQGYPISGEFQEASEIDGNTYTVQYFERSVFELHNRDQAPKSYVLLSLLGSLHYKQVYRKGTPPQKPNTTPGSVLFPQTGKRLGGAFLDYWNTHGGLPQQGYPITDEFQETSELDGKPYTVQYFERAVFELHPENQPPYNVLLSQLGTFRLKSKYPSGLAAGIWGGDHVALQASDTGATLEFDCAHGTINRPVVLDPAGNFEVEGVYVQEHGGPLSPDEPQDSHPARYTGVTNGDTMTLKITLTDSNQNLGTFILFHGKVPKIVKCL